MEEAPSGLNMNMHRHKSKASLWILIILLVLALGAIAWLVWQWLNLSQQNTALLSEKVSLQAQIKELSDKLVITKPDDSDDPAVCDPTITDQLKDDIATAVSSGDYASLQAHMTDPITVILAASEGIGPRTPAEAVADMAYLNSGADPWDFDLPAATIANWEAGFYTDYFDENTYAGRAANGMVVVFDFNECAKISDLFFVANEELLL